VPTLDQVPSITLATGSQSYTNGTVQANAFLNTGYCGPNGGNCTIVDISMNDTISIVVVDLIPTNVFTVPVNFTYFDGCDGAGVSCLSSTCVNAIRDPSENSGMVTCSMAGAGVLVTFCPDLEVTAPSTVPLASASAVSSAAPTSTSTSSSSKAGIIGGIAGGVLALVILIAGVFCFFRRRRGRAKQGEEHAIQKFDVPAPYSTVQLNANLLMSPKRTSQGILSNTDLPVITPIEHSGTTSPISQQSAGVRQLPLPPNSSAPASDASGSPHNPNLDSIIAGLAERFGWTVPPSGEDSFPPPGPPEYS